jgi:hypothetical protein
MHGSNGFFSFTGNLCVCDREGFSPGNFHFAYNFFFVHFCAGCLGLPSRKTREIIHYVLELGNCMLIVKMW